MELKEGYKKTEVGEIPEDWEVKTISELQPFITSGSRSWSKFYSNYGFPFLRITNMIRGSICLEIEDLRLVNLPENENEGKRTQLLPGDILISITADIGIISYVDNSIPKPSYINQHIALVRFKSERINTKYLSYFLVSANAQRHFISLTDSGAKAGMSLIRVGKIKISIPAIEEQTAIATALSDTDALIASLEKLIAKKRMIKQGVMQKLLTPREDWEVKKLGELCEIKKGQLITEKTKVDGNIPVVAGGKTISYYHNEANRKGKTITISGSGASAGYVSFHNYPIFASDCSTISENDSYSIEFIYYILLFFQEKIYRMQTGGAQPHVHPRDVYPLLVPLPQRKEQIKIATILSDMNFEIEALETKLAKYKQVKQGMMQQLLTGKIRLVKPESKMQEEELAVAAESYENYKKKEKRHNEHFNDAVLIGTMAKEFGSDEFPLTRFMYTKVSYLLKRYKEERDEGYLKKAAGPYKPQTRYGGAETIALNRKYVKSITSTYQGKKYENFLADDNSGEAVGYFIKWYGEDALEWIRQFKFVKRNQLELWATVDMAIEDLKREGKLVNVETVKQLINNHKEWRPKLKRPVFSDENIKVAIIKSGELFG